MSNLTLFYVVFAKLYEDATKNIKFTNSLTAMHWIVSDIPLRLIVIYSSISAAVYIWLRYNPDLFWIFMSSIGFVCSTGISIIMAVFHYDQKIESYDRKLEKIIIPQFLEHRPFKEKNLVQRDELLGRILKNVNTKFVSKMRKQYILKNSEQLVEFYDHIIAGFTKRYFEKYTDTA